MSVAVDAAESNVVTVVPDVSGIDRVFHYLVPSSLVEAVEIGSIVRVPLRGRRVRAWVIDCPSPPYDLDISSLREIVEFVSVGPSLHLVDLARFGAWRYGGRLRPFLKASSPERIVKKLEPFASGRDQGEREVLSHKEDQPTDDALGDASRLALSERCAVLQVPPSASRHSITEAACDAIDGEVLVLVPEHRDAEVLARLLERRGRRVARWPDAWTFAASGARVVVGTRSAVLARMRDLQAIVVIDAHAQAYVSQRTPTWNATVLATERARRAGIPCVLVSPCPTLENLREGKLVSLARDRERAGWPVVEVIDRRGDDPRTGLYGEGLASSVHRARREDPNRPVVCVFNRIGRARLLACTSCNELARCERCGGAVSQGERGESHDVEELVCSRCGLQRPFVCANCGSTRLKTLRVGVGRMREELSALTGLDVDEVSSSTDQSGPYGGDAPVIVGTEAVLHRVNTASLVVFVDFDQHLCAPRFRAGEAALALLVLAGRLVGARTSRTRREVPGRVAIQTRLPDHEVIRAAVAGNPATFTDVEAPRREALRLPPTWALATIAGDDVADFRSRLALVEGIEVASLDEKRTVVRAPRHETLCDAIDHARRPDERVRVEVDPLDL